jgi:hypothetical protein
MTIHPVASGDTLDNQVSCSELKAMDTRISGY